MKTDNGKIAPPTTGTPVSMTLFIPLSIKAMETKRKNPVIIDKKAVEIIERIDELLEDCFLHSAYGGPGGGNFRDMDSFSRTYTDRAGLLYYIQYGDAFNRTQAPCTV
jgi:O-methyltransferase involved in polyketide biosynthesis